MFLCVCVCERLRCCLSSLSIIIIIGCRHCGQCERINPFQQQQQNLLSYTNTHTHNPLSPNFFLAVVCESPHNKTKRTIFANWAIAPQQQRTTNKQHFLKSQGHGGGGGGGVLLLFYIVHVCALVFCFWRERERRVCITNKCGNEKKSSPWVDKMLPIFCFKEKTRKKGRGVYRERAP